MCTTSKLPMAAALLLKLECKMMRTKTPNIFDVCLREHYIFINVVRWLFSESIY